MGKQAKKIARGTPRQPALQDYTAGAGVDMTVLHRYHLRHVQPRTRAALARDAALFMLVVAIIVTNVVLGVWK